MKVLNPSHRCVIFLMHFHGLLGSPLYNALSTWCIQIPGISTLQWHFFSGASSPLDKKQALTIIIKPLGGWTNTLRDQFSGAKKGDSASCPFSFKARVEGPYGDESDFYLQYILLATNPSLILSFHHVLFHAFRCFSLRLCQHLTTICVWVFFLQV